ncbi:hypothetical protein BDW_07810 [Bdellovibrio bacteriovorus W]|nr:hypothetical protein BDW_07810 [Bdellovibrio bacteriovorus W]
MKKVTEMICRYLQQWDPIGVTESLMNEGLELNEYDSYAGPLYSLLSQGASIEEVYQYLKEILDYMGMPPVESRDLKFAQSLHTYFNKSSGFRK